LDEYGDIGVILLEKYQPSMRSSKASVAQSLLTRPFPRPEATSIIWRRIALTSAFVTLFLLVFRPFGLHNVPAGQILAFVAYGCVTAVAMTLVGIVLPMMFTMWFDERRWSIGKEIGMAAVTIGVIAVGNALFSAWYFGFAVTASMALGFVLITAAIGVFPATAIVLAQAGRYQKKYSAAAERLDADLVKPVPLLKEEQAVIMDDEGRATIETAANDVLCMWSADNYVEVVMRRGGTVSRHLVRTSLRSIETHSQLPERFWRCHRSVIVNTSLVEHVSGNAQGYLLHIDGIDPIPVARSKNRDLGQRLRSQTVPTTT